MHHKRLGETDIMLSKISLGGSAFGNVFGSCSEDDVKDIISTAFEHGVNYIDTSPFYGQSELVIGKVLASLNVARNSFYISTKVGRYGPIKGSIFDYSSKRIEESVRESLSRLQLDYLDIVFTHDIEFASSLDIIVNETLPALAKLKEQGKIRYIGISAYPLEVLRKVVERSHVKIDVILTYCHYSINDTSLLDYIQFFKSKKIGIINASPHSMGLLCPNGPMEWHPASEELKVVSKRAIDYCQKEGVSITKLAINFSSSNDLIDSTLSSCIKEDYLKENIKAVQCQLSKKEEMVLKHIQQEFFGPVKTKTWESGNKH